LYTGTSREEKYFFKLDVGVSASFNVDFFKLDLYASVKKQDFSRIQFEGCLSSSFLASCWNYSKNVSGIQSLHFNVTFDRDLIQQVKTRNAYVLWHISANVCCVRGTFLQIILTPVISQSLYTAFPCSDLYTNVRAGEELKLMCFVQLHLPNRQLLYKILCTEIFYNLRFIYCI